MPIKSIFTKGIVLSLLKIINNARSLKDKTIDNSLNTFQRNIIQTQKRFLASIINLLDSLTKSDGLINLIPDNMSLILNSAQALNDELINAGYGKAVDEYISATNELISHVKSISTLVGIDKAFTAKDVQTLHLIQNSITQRFDNLGLQSIQEIINQIQQGIMGNNTYKELVTKIAGTITGEDTSGGLLSKYASTYAQDCIMGVNRDLDLMVGNNNETEFYLYLHPDDDATRDWCAERANKVYSVDEINAMSNPVGTDVWTECGGYGCRGEWLPISSEMLDNFDRG
jgi:hypothetical protein